MTNDHDRPDALVSEFAALRQRVSELEGGATAVTLAEEALLRFEKAIETMQIGVTITDVNGTILYTNPADARMHGYGVDELVGRDAGVFSPSKQMRQRLTSEELALMTSWQRETTNKRKDGTTFPVHLMSDVVRNSEGEPIGIISTCEDISERKQAETALRNSEERYTLAAEGANDGLWDWDLNSNTIYYSPRWSAMLGYGSEEIRNNPDEWLKRVHPEDRDRLQSEIDAHLNEQTPHLESEHRIQHRNGSYRWVLCRGMAVRNVDNRPHRIAGSFGDLTARKRVEEQLLHDAVHDQLTGLPNRGVMIRALQRSIGRAERKRDYSFAVLHVDVDRFKLYNDSLGHPAGDRLLVEIAARLAACIRPADMLVRLGSDEFAILLDDIDDFADPTRVAKRIHEVLHSPFELEEREVFCTASIGIALGSTKYRHPEEVLRDATTAMGRAKARGNACHEVFDGAMHKRAIEVLHLETGLRWALERNELLLHYQPIVSLATGEITSVEALVRWQHPERGLIHPDDFIPLAEESGLIVPIGWHVLRMSCEQMRAWQVDLPSERSVRLCVNLSPKQFTQPDVVDQVKMAIGKAGIDPGLLRLEMTENAVMENAETAFPRMSELQSLDVRLHMDDFGTGYSSLSYLHKLPIDTLKIDRSFILDLGVRDEALEIVKTIVTLAHNLGMQVVAEGVETKEQLTILRTLECEYAQGFYFSEPIDEAAVAELFRSGARLL